MSEDLLEDLQGQPGMTRTALTQASDGRARLLTSLSQECDIETQSCPLHSTIETPSGLVRFTVQFIVLPGGGRCGYHRAEDAEGETQHRRHGAAHGLWTEGTERHCAGMELTARSMGYLNHGAVLRVAMAVTASTMTRQTTWTMRSR